MAMRIVSSRLAAPSLPARVFVAPMSTKSSKPSSVTTRTVKRESLKSWIGSIFGGSYDAADPKDGPIPAKEVQFPDVTEHATGEEKLLLLAFENGFLDPYCNLPTVRNGRGSKDNPVKIESFVNDRIVACICEPSQTYVKYMHLYRGEPKRCQCGHWMELVDAPRFWEKIPKEDLLQIPYIKELEEEGRFDEVMRESAVKKS